MISYHKSRVGARKSITVGLPTFIFIVSEVFTLKRTGQLKRNGAQNCHRIEATAKRGHRHSHRLTKNHQTRLSVYQWGIFSNAYHKNWKLKNWRQSRTSSSKSGGGAPVPTPNPSQNSGGSSPCSNIMISLMFFRSFLLIFSARRRALDFIVCLACEPIHTYSWSPRSSTNMKPGSSDSGSGATDSRWIWCPYAWTRYIRFRCT